MTLRQAVIEIEKALLPTKVVRRATSFGNGYLEKLKIIIDISLFDIVKLRPVIKRIESSGEIRRRQEAQRLLE